MRDHIPQLLAEVAQNAASSKPAMIFGAATASIPAWIQMIHSDSTQAIIVVLGIIVSITIIAVNVQAIVTRAKKNRIMMRQEKLRLALLENQAAEKGLKID